jgi:hypothetical protein
MGGEGSMSSNRCFANTSPPATERYSSYPYGEDRNPPLKRREDAPGRAASEHWGKRPPARGKHS